MRQRTAAYTLLGLVLVALLLPPLRASQRDSYPLSTYPMFSHERGRLSAVATVVGVDGDGEVRRLDPHLVGGTDEVMLAVTTASRAVRAGKERAAGLCREVAERIAASSRDELVGVEVRVETHDAVARFADGDREPRSVTTHARCEVRS